MDNDEPGLMPAGGLELLAVPSLELTLRWHRACDPHTRQDTWYDADDVPHEDDDDVPHEMEVPWADAFQEQSQSLLLALGVIAEIERALAMLGYAPWGDEAAEEPTGVLQTIDVYEKVTQDAFAQIILPAIELVKMAHALRDDWVYEEIHIYYVNNMDQVTLDEWELTGQELPTIAGLPDWNDVEHIEDESYLFDGEVLIAACHDVLRGLVKLILDAERADSSASQPGKGRASDKRS